MNKKILVVLAAAVIFSMCPAGLAQAAGIAGQSGRIEGNFSYQSGTGQSEYATGRIAPFEYEDSYFAQAPEIYSHGLAKMSLALSLATYDYGELEWLLGEIGFGQIAPNEYYARSDGEKTKTEPDNIGIAMANKKIGNYTVVAAVIRGFSYGAEWAGNFNIGQDEKFHAGFKQASEIAMEEIASYLRNQNISGDIKIWLAGYSRGGAVANLVAGELCETRAFDSAEVYAYCFEVPMGLRQPNGKRADFGGIFNIVNPNDIVAKIAMAEWGFCRYGKDIFLPSAESAGNYGELSERMKETYAKYRPGYPNEPDLIDDFLLGGSLGAFIDKALKSAASVLDNDAYVEKFQQKLVDSFASAYGLDLDLDFFSLISSAPEIALPLLGHLGEINAAMENMDVIFMAHYPDLCLAWMHSLGGDELTPGGLPFADVKTSDWFYGAVLGVHENNLMAGTSGSTFEPNGKVTLAQAIAMAARIHAGGDDAFKDAGGADWHEVYVGYARANGIIGSDDFPNYGENATRAQVAYIFANALPAGKQGANSGLAPPDVNEGDEYGKQIYLLYRIGILAGVDDEGTFLPDGETTRAEAAAMLLRIHDFLSA